MYWACILMCLISGILCQQCDQVDPCAPVYPCQLDSVMSEPANCEVYNECVAPYEYVVTNVECGGTKGNFDNTTCTCDPIFECNTWECPPSSITPEPPIQSAPCFLEVLDCLTAYITVPDRYYCTKYFECDNGEWLSRTCPPAAQYYDVTLPFLNPPCRNNVARCDSILFDECLDFTTKHVTTDPTTKQPTTHSLSTLLTTHPRTSDFTSTAATPPSCIKEIDPCAPVYPCQLGSVMSEPTNCQVYNECVAPYEYVTTNVECGGNKGSFSNNTCTCDPIFECHTWECPPSSITPEPPIQSAPCLLEVVDCLTAYITVPDRYYCTKYFECDNGEWLSRTCPPDAQYYDITLPFINPPCRNNVARCNSIPFDECLDFTTKHVTTDHTTEQPTTYSLSTLLTTHPMTSDITSTDATPTSCITDRDGCDPPMLCTPGDQMAYPPDCTTFLVCTSLFEWIVNPGNVCAHKGPYNNETCECDLSAECDERACPPTQTDPTLPSLPCAPNRTHCQQFSEGATVADRTHCTNYFRCVSDLWVMEDCPPEESYYDERLAGDPVPCVNNPSVCEDNNECTYLTPPKTAGN